MKSWPAGISKNLEYRLGEKPLHEYLQQNGRDFPDKAAYIFYGREITWKELADYTRRFANYLTGMGITKGDRVALFMQNSPQYIIAHYGTQMIGAVVTPCSAMFKEWELEYEIQDAGAGVLVTTDDLYPVVEKIRDKLDLEAVVVTNYGDMLPPEPTLPLPDELRKEKKVYLNTQDFIALLADHPAEVPEVAIDIWNDVSMMVYTSGTTGRPKGAMLTYGNALFKIAQSSQFTRSLADDISLAVMPVFHIAGNVQGLGMPVYGGATTVLLTRFDPETVVRAFERYHCTNWYAITPMLLAIMKVPRAGQIDWSALRYTSCTSFGVPLTEDVAGLWREFTKGSPVWEAGYGLSETHTCDCAMPYDKVKFGPTGIPLFDTDLRIMDPETGKELSVNEPGEIVIRNPGVFKGYWNKPEATQATLRDGWLSTGDIGRIDDDGYLYFMGRIKEMIKCSGYSVFPEDVEVLLLHHPAVAQVGVIGVPDPARGESVKAFIVLKPEYRGKITEAEMIAWSKEKMASYKYPRVVEFRESLPVTGAGKILRRLIK
ncbi:MAG: AMP-binding protein [Deltaproteobacteria bacterium]|nr:AMP-binding protein [Deltaproteobacteria bacterium]